MKKRTVRWLALLTAGVLFLFPTACQKNPTDPADFDPDIPREQFVEKYLNPDISTMTKKKDGGEKSNAVYVTEDGTEFFFDPKTGEYRGFNPDTVPQSEIGEAISEEALRKTADQWASYFIPLKEYTRNYYYQEDLDLHKFYYIRMVAGMDTEEIGHVWLRRNGQVEFCKFCNIGLFKNYKAPSSLTVEKMDEKFFAYIEKNNLPFTEIERRLLCYQGDAVYAEYTYLPSKGDELE